MIASATIRKATASASVGADSSVSAAIGDKLTLRAIASSPSQATATLRDAPSLSATIPTGGMEPFVITATLVADNNYILDKTGSEIRQAISGNRFVEIVTLNDVFPFTMQKTILGSSYLIFGGAVYADFTIFQHGMIVPDGTGTAYGVLVDSAEAIVANVNGAIGAVTLTAEDVNALPDDTVIPTVPTNVSAFVNDANYITLADLPIYDGGVE